jgi:outer membrane protein TolC
MGLAAGCSAQHYRESADREVYQILRAKSAQVPEMLPDFTIEKPKEPVLPQPAPAAPAGQAPGPSSEAGKESQPAGVGPAGPQDPAPQAEAQQPAPQAAAVPEAPAGLQVESPGAQVISLQQALAIASANNRDLQSQRESLFLSALSLTLQRFQFAPQFFGTVSGTYDNTDTGDTRQVQADTSFGFNWLLATGTRFSVSLASSFSEFLTGDPRRAASSLFNVNVTQPLLQGAGIAVTEPLTQAERDVAYQMRTFVRYRQTFFVSVLSSYYRVLEQRQILDNEQLNYERLKLARERAEWLGQAGELADFEVDQVRQDELSAESGVQNALQSYYSSLDEFKITLGIPVETVITLDRGEMTQLGSKEVTELALRLENAIQVALERRPDLMTARDRVEDAKRKVEVAANDLLPGLDLSGSLNTDTAGDTKPLNFQAERTDFSAGVDLDLPLNRMAERNAYRRSLIDLDRQERTYTQARDQVILDVRNDMRDYELALRTQEIQKKAVGLAERRVDSTVMLQEAGRATTRDMLDARRSLLSAQNALARTIVDFETSKLALAVDMGVLVVDSNGQVKEPFESHE